MRNILPFLLIILLIGSFTACGDDATRPAPSHNDGTVQGEIGDSDFEFEIGGGEPGEPPYGPFLLRGRNLHYDDEAGALVVDLTVQNLGSFPHREPVGLTFIQLDPDEVTVFNPDNDIHGDGAAIVFQFANDDGVWTPDESSFPRTVEFGVAKGVSIAFVARLDLGDAIDGGAIAGRVWEDMNQDGIMQDGEPGIPGVGIYLFSFSDEEDSTNTREFGYTTTDHDGRYVFRPLRAGAYVVQRATVHEDCIPTTSTEIHVLLVEFAGEVSSYRNANFGCVGRNIPPSPVGQRVRVTGKYYDPRGFAADRVEPLPCPDDSLPPPVEPDPDCYGGRLRGFVTEVAPARNAFRVMETWVTTDAIHFPDDLQVGNRVDVHVRQGPGPTGWIMDSFAHWPLPYDELRGRVDAAEPGPDGALRLLVLDTWVSAWMPVPAD